MNEGKRKRESDENRKVLGGWRKCRGSQKDADKYALRERPLKSKVFSM